MAFRHQRLICCLNYCSASLNQVGFSRRCVSIWTSGLLEEYQKQYCTLSCGVPDYGGCQLWVTHMRPDGPGPMPNPDPVEGWEGTIVTNSAWAQIDDAFVLSGDYPVHYGIWSEDPTLAAQLKDYRNSGTAIRVWGQVICGLSDANGCQIQVRRLEEALGAEP